MFTLRRKNSLALCLAVLAAALTGCQFGPSALQVSNAQYSDAVRIAQSQDLLVNLVRLRYRDLPVFLAISSISTQFEFRSSGDISGTLVENVGPSTAKSADSLGISGSIGYSERPTITFSIMGGEAFQKRMLAPLKVVAISRLTESGWRADRVLRLTVEALNGLQHASSASGPTPSRAPPFRDFLEVTQLLEALRQANVIGFEYQNRCELVSNPIPVGQVDGGDLIAAAKVGLEFKAASKDGHVQLMLQKRKLVMRFNPRSADSPDAQKLRKLLRLKPEQTRFDLVPVEESDLDPFTPEQPVGELAINTRSLMGVLYFLSNAVQPPPAHLQAGLVTTTLDDRGHPFDWSQMLGDLFQVHSSPTRPKHAAVKVRHRGYWFYIADDDATSKSTFSLLNQIFALQAGDVEEQKPVLTLPVGG